LHFIFSHRIFNPIYVLGGYVMQRFIQWLETTDSGTTMVYDPAIATQPYISGMVSTDSGAGATTATSPSGVSTVSDPAIATHIGSLKTIHDQLRNIFADIRQRTAAFRSQQMRGAFERELMSGVDGVGRSHAILAPSGVN